MVGDTWVGNGKENWIGSEFRDQCKNEHKKRLGRGYYASDLDLVLVSFNPLGVVAFLDYKKFGDTISPSEMVLYSFFISKGVPGYILESDTSEGPFKVSEYKDHGGSRMNMAPILNYIGEYTWDQIKNLEDELRKNPIGGAYD